MPFVNVKVIEGVFSPQQKGEIVENLTEAMVNIKGENMRGVTWIVVEEVERDWGIGGNALTTADVKGAGSRCASSQRLISTLQTRGRRPSRAEPSKRVGRPLSRCDGQFQLFESSGKPSGSHTQLSWVVDDLDAVVEQLHRNGVVFEEYDMPGFKTESGIAEIAGERGAWFKDSEGNLLALGERTS